MDGSKTEATKPMEAVFHFCPRCGSKNDNVGSIPFRCPQCKMAYFFGPVAAVGGLVGNDQGELLLVRRARDPGKGKWGLPGGFVDRGETIEEALQREVMEETQLTIASMSLLMTHPNTYDYRGVAAPVIDLFFDVKVSNPESIKLNDGELDHYEWVRPNAKHLSDMAFPSNRIAIEYWLDR